MPQQLYQFGYIGGRLMDVQASIALPEVPGHPNRTFFEGVLTLVNKVSKKAPSGARGHRVVVTRAAAQAALPSLVGMAVNCKEDFTGHDGRRNVGVITEAGFDGNRMMVRGFLFERDFPEVVAKARERELGMSFELSDAHVRDMRRRIWWIDRLTFMGAAVLLRGSAAYEGTSFTILPKRVRVNAPQPGDGLAA